MNRNRPLVLREGDRELLAAMALSGNRRMARHAKALLMSADGVVQTEVARRVGVSQSVVSRWRQRYVVDGSRSVLGHHGSKPTTLQLREGDRDRLERLARDSDRMVARKARALLLMADCTPVGHIADELAAPKSTISNWRTCYQSEGLEWILVPYLNGRRGQAPVLCDSDRQQLEALALSDIPDLARRARALLLLSDGMRRTDVALQIGVNPNTVSTWRRWYEVYGLDRFRLHPRTRLPPLGLRVGDRQQLEELAVSDQHQVAARASVLLAAADGMAPVEIAHRTGVSYATARDWCKAYEASGLSSVWPARRGRPPKSQQVTRSDRPVKPGRRRAKADFVELKLAQAYRDGSSLSELANAFGLSVKGIRIKLKRQNVEMRPAGCGARIDVPYQEVAALYQAGWTAVQLARIIDMSATTVLRRLAEMGVKIRSREEQRGLPPKTAWDLADVAAHLSDEPTDELADYLRSLGVKPLISCKARPMWDSAMVRQILDEDKRQRIGPQVSDAQLIRAPDLAELVGLKDSQAFRRYVTETLRVTPVKTRPACWNAAEVCKRVEDDKNRRDSSYRLAAEWLSSITNDGTRRTYDIHITRWLDWLTAKGIEPLAATEADVDEWLAQLRSDGASDGKMRLYLAAATQFYKHSGGAVPTRRRAKKRRQRLPRTGAVSRTVHETGVVSLHGHSIVIGRQWAHASATVYWQGNDVGIVIDGKVVRSLTLDPNVRYQPLSHDEDQVSA